MSAKPVRRWFLWAGGLFTAACGGVLIWWVFQANATDPVDLPGVATALSKKRWGKYVEIRIDQSGDGKADFVNEYEPGIDGMTTRQQWSRRWMDLDYDGRLDVDMIFRRGRGVVEVRLDTDQDGTYDKKLLGDAAAAFERELRHAWRRR